MKRAATLSPCFSPLPFQPFLPCLVRRSIIWPMHASSPRLTRPPLRRSALRFPCRCSFRRWALPLARGAAVSFPLHWEQDDGRTPRTTPLSRSFPPSSRGSRSALSGAFSCSLSLICSVLREKRLRLPSRICAICSPPPPFFALPLRLPSFCALRDTPGVPRSVFAREISSTFFSIRSLSAPFPWGSRGLLWRR